MDKSPSAGRQSHRSRRLGNSESDWWSWRNRKDGEKDRHYI